MNTPTAQPGETLQAYKDRIKNSATTPEPTHKELREAYWAIQYYQHELGRLVTERNALAQLIVELSESASYWSEYDVPIGIVERIQEAAKIASADQHGCINALHIALAAPTDEWIHVSDVMPRTHEEVDIAYVDHHGKLQTTMGWYCPAKTLESSSFDGEVNDEYDEETDTYYLKEQWVDESQESEYHYPITGVTHWKPRSKHPDFNPLAKGD